MSTDLAATPELAGHIVARVAAYLQRLGCSDPALIQSLAQECLQRARLRAAPGSEPELLRRSLEEAQRRFNQALGAALHLAPGPDERPLAAARAAFLLRGEKLDADALFRADARAAHTWCDEVSATLPHSTPPESPLDVPVKPMRFWLFKS